MIDANRKCSLLLVDDHREWTYIFALYFRKRGYSVQEAHTGQSAIDLAVQSLPDFALLDFALPDMSGFEVARALKANRRTAPIRLILLSGYGDDPAILSECHRAGFEHCLGKGGRIHQVQAILEAGFPRIISPIFSNGSAV